MTTNAISLHHAGIAKIGQDLVTAGNLVKSFSTAPEKLDSAELPALYTLTGSATDNEDYGEREENVVRIYRVQVPVIPTGQATPTIRETRCRTLLEIVKKELKKHPQLYLTEGVVEAKVIGDSGVVILPEFGMAFVGFEVRLSVRYTDTIQFSIGE